MAQLEDLLRAQKEVAGRVERFIANTRKAGKEKMIASFLKKRQQLLDDYWKEFQAGHRTIACRSDAEGSDYLESDLYSQIEDAYLSQAVELDDLIQRSEPPRRSASDRDADRDSASCGDPNVLLPRATLPTFSGDMLEWEGFRDLFQSMVDEIKGISNVRRLQYLKSSLKGEAAKMLQNTSISSSNYEAAWTALERRYGNRRRLSEAHMRRLVTCSPSVKGQPGELKRLLDEFSQARDAFKSLGKPVDAWDEWLVFLLSERLDQSTRLSWEDSLRDPYATPVFSELETFLENRVHSRTASSNATSNPPRKDTAAGKSKENHRGQALQSKVTMATNLSEPPPKDKGSKKFRNCSMCSGKHPLGSCHKYKTLSVADRLTYVQKEGLCLSCLYSGHSQADCPSTNRCWACGAKHHTTLHDLYGSRRPANDATASASVSSTFVASTTTRQVVLLATAQVTLESSEGRLLPVRALIDTAAESSFISEWAVQALRLRRRPVHLTLTGHQETPVGVARQEVTVRLRSRVDDAFTVDFGALVSKRLTTPTPSRPISADDWEHIKGLPLADAHFGTPSRVDVLLGADVCARLFSESREGPPGTPAAIPTPLGWVLLGAVDLRDSGTAQGSARVLHVRCDTELQEQLRRFWDLEEMPSNPALTPDELTCEETFNREHRRDASGRYHVRLPFRDVPSLPAGPSRRVALRLLLGAERRQLKDAELKAHYQDFLAEYLRLGHMEEAASPLADDAQGFYLPHHAVWKSVGDKKKIRVVFNASCPSACGRSLNDELLPGPKLQSELWIVLSRWRLFQFAFSTDIVKMFRQIGVRAEDQDWQRILWRSEPSAEVREYRLTSVTYGTASAPYLALRVLRQLAEDEKDRFPLGSQVIRDHSYVDDILAGGDTLQQTWEVRRQLEGILLSGGFPLDRWASNIANLGNVAAPKTSLFQESEIHGALGLQWDTRTDSLTMKGPRCRPHVNPDHWTKRSALSMVASLFDPLGWMAPVLIQARILLQDLWLAGLDWDDPIPSELAARWSAFMDEVDSLTGMVVPRWVGFSSVGTVVEVHGFADASERAYSAAVYLRVIHPSQSAKLSLLAARTKVAPTKLQSIPRLELCGALLLARLQSTLQNSLSLGRVKAHSWTDASVALAWIRAHPSKWKPFVAHRVAEIQRLLPDTTWRHISTTDNPADLATRGISSAELRTASLWWNGPTWLNDASTEWPSLPTSLDPGTIPDQRSGTVVAVHQVVPPNEYFSRFSKWSRLVRVTAYILRFARNARSSSRMLTGPLSASEHHRAETTIFRLNQLEGYPLEIEALTRGKPLRVSSPLISLTPFIDSDGVMRVGGRIQDAPVPYAQRHPIILSRHTHVATLIIEAAHLCTLHGGVDLTRSSLLQRFWIPRSRPLVKKLLRRCLRCTRFKAATGQQQMGNIPGVRLQPSKPFEHSGVDYAGPIQIRASKGRGQKAYKGYMVVFVCLCTKAVHLDAVSDLTSITFIAAFQRFVSRRGRCAQLWSDNSTTFRGADAELRRMFQGTSEFRRAASQELAAKGTEWRFIPPYAPHFGGLWEAAVKSAKYHIKRTIGDQKLTYEELSTLLCQVEACLNSRPLMPITEDAKDLLPLTPGHFLIGEPVTSLETSSDVDFEVTGLKRWRLVNNLRNHFWRRWQQEYLHLLQQRPKWRTRVENLREGSLVLIRNELSPPTKWPLARVVKVHTGTDGLVRVATLQTAAKTCTRPLTKIIPLPVQINDAESNDTSQ